MKKILIVLTFISLTVIGSCKKDKDPDICSSNWTLQLTDEIQGMMTAAMTYSSSPTTANCNAYKTSIQAYLNALRQFSSCTGWTAVQRQDLEESIEEAEQDLATACQ